MLLFRFDLSFFPYFFRNNNQPFQEWVFYMVSMRCSGCFLSSGLDWDLSKRQTNVLAINFHNIFTNSDDSNRRDMAHEDANTAQLIDNRSTHVCAFNRRVPERNGIREREREKSKENCNCLLRYESRPFGVDDYFVFLFHTVSLFFFFCWVWNRWHLAMIFSLKWTYQQSIETFCVCGRPTRMAQISAG